MRKRWWWLAVLFLVALIAAIGSREIHRAAPDRVKPGPPPESREVLPPSLEEEDEVGGKAEPAQLPADPVGTVEGFVSRRDGNSIPRLPLEAQPMEHSPAGVLVDWKWRGSGVRTVTDDAGRFLVELLSKERHAFRSLDRGWVLLGQPLVKPGDHDIHLVARPALSLKGTFVDAVTGATIEKAYVELSLEVSGGNSRSVGATAHDGLIDLVWAANPGEVDSVLEGKLTVQAQGYESAKAVVRYQPGKPSATVDVRLGPLATHPNLTHILEVADDRGEPVRIPLYVWHESTRRRITPISLGDGRWRLHAPAGKRHVVVRPEWVIGEVEWAGEILFESGREGVTRCRLPPFGTLVVRYAGEGNKVGVFEPVDESLHAAFLLYRDENRFVVRTGEWRVSLSDVAGSERCVVVHPGGETVVEFADG